MIQHAMMSFQVVLHLIIVLLTMVQIVFAIKTVIIKMLLHFLQGVLKILPTMTIHQIQYNIFNYFQTLPPLENNHNYFGSPKIHAHVICYNHRTNPQSHFVNASFFSPPSQTVVSNRIKQTTTQKIFLVEKPIYTKLKKIYSDCLKILLLQLIPH